MTISETFMLALEAYRDLQPELKEKGRDLAPIPEIPSLSEILSGMDPLPSNNIVLGIAEDKLPILLDVYDPDPGPILVVGDGSCGKTTLLQSIASSLDFLQETGDIQFSVVTNFPMEWERVETAPASIGVWPIYHQSACNLLAWLTSWGDQPDPGKNAMLLFLDDLELIVNTSQEIRKHLHWLLRYGPRYHIWPIATVNSIRALRIDDWLKEFRTRIYGNINSSPLASELGVDREINLANLFPGIQFVLQFPEKWLKFTLPSI